MSGCGLLGVVATFLYPVTYVLQQISEIDEEQVFISFEPSRIELLYAKRFSIIFELFDFPKSYDELNVAVSNQEPLIVVVQVIGKLSIKKLLGDVVIVNASVDQLLTSILDLSIENIPSVR